MNFENCIDLLREFETEEGLSIFDSLVEAFRQNPRIVFCIGLDSVGGKDYEPNIVKGMFYGVMLAALSNDGAIIEAIRDLKKLKAKD